MGKVGRTVQRIDIPAEFPIQAVARSLFAVNAVIRKRLAQSRPDQFLHRAVGDRDQINIALVFRLDTLGKELAQA